MIIVKVEFTRRQWRVFLGCFLCYSSTYMIRLNLPAALNGMMGDMRLTAAQGGLLQTVFALVYAIGQFVNGALVDRVSARRHILLGLGVSGLFNVLFGLATRYWMLVVLWGLNGVSQSMIWTPVVKLIATWFRGKRRSQASFGITLSLIAGNLCAWALSGFMASAVSWRWSFILPGAWAVLAGAISWMTLRDQPEPGEDLGEEAPGHETAFAGRIMPVRALLLSTGLVPLLVCCVGNGFVRDGIVTWAPTIIARLNPAAALDPTLTSLFIPLLTLFGVLLARRVYAMLGGSARGCAVCMQVLCTAFAFLLVPAGRGVYACALLLGLCCSASNGVNPMLVTFIPMEYERVGRVGLVAGVMDSFIYLGSAMAGVISGAVSDAAGWGLVFVLWGAAGVLSCAAGALSMRGVRRLHAWEG